MALLYDLRFKTSVHKPEVDLHYAANFQHLDFLPGTSACSPSFIHWFQSTLNACGKYFCRKATKQLRNMESAGRKIMSFKILIIYNPHDPIHGPSLALPCASPIFSIACPQTTYLCRSWFLGLLLPSNRVILRHFNIYVPTKETKKKHLRNIQKQRLLPMHLIATFQQKRLFQIFESLATRSFGKMNLANPELCGCPLVYPKGLGMPR